MAKIDIIGIKELSGALVKETEALLNSTAAIYAEEARKNTPKRSGNARRNWSKTINKHGFEVENRVPYIERLEAGSSKQAPRGIIRPTLRGANRRMK